MANQQGIFITIEGVEGVGKSTAIHYIVRSLQELGQEVIVTREPGGTEIAEEIRQVLLQHHHEKMASDTELLLMFASRAQHLASIIMPNLVKGITVVSDRFTDATYAYQGGGRGVDIARIQILEAWVQGHLQPDFTLLLDAPIEVGIERILSRGPKDRIEQETIDFFHRVRQSYLDRARQYPYRFRMVDATLPLDEVEREIKTAMHEFFSGK